MDDETPEWGQIVGVARTLRARAEAGTFDPTAALALARAILAFDGVKKGVLRSGTYPVVRLKDVKASARE